MGYANGTVGTVGQRRRRRLPPRCRLLDALHRAVGRSARARTVVATWYGSAIVLCLVVVRCLWPMTLSKAYVGEDYLEPWSPPAPDGCDDYGCALYPADIASDRIVNASLEPPAMDPWHRGRAVPFASATAAVLTRRGNDPHPNQDRAFVIEPFLTRQTPVGTASFLVAVLDGHGVLGHRVAEYLRTALPRRLAEKLNARPCCQPEIWIQQQLNDTFIEVDREGSPNLLRGGSTASVTLRIGPRLYFANCGDSLTMLARQDAGGGGDATTRIVYQTRRDKAHLPDERRRIESLGGTIFVPKQAPAQSRVIVYSVAASPHEPIGLAMSRSIGDWEWKLYGVTAEPIVDVVSVPEAMGGGDSPGRAALFVVAASDGVWEMRPRREFFAERIGRNLVTPQGTTKHAPLWKICVDIMWAIMPQNPKWYRDDMTLVAIKVM